MFISDELFIAKGIRYDKISIISHNILLYPPKYQKIAIRRASWIFLMALKVSSSSSSNSGKSSLKQHETT